MNTQQLIDEIVQLPVEDRVRVADTVLSSLNHTDPDIDAAWVGEAERRVREMQSNAAIIRPGEEVFSRIASRFSR